MLIKQKINYKDKRICFKRVLFTIQMITICNGVNCKYSATLSILGGNNRGLVVKVRQLSSDMCDLCGRANAICFHQHLQFYYVPIC